MRRKLRRLTADPLASRRNDPEFIAFKTRQYECAFPGPQELDATGREIDTPPVVKDVEIFKPKVKRDDAGFRVIEVVTRFQAAWGLTHDGLDEAGERIAIAIGTSP